MSATPALLVLLLLASSPGSGEEVPGAVPIPRLEPGAPVLSWGQRTYCLRRGGEDGLEWRAQCDEKTRTCLVAPNFEIDGDGRPAGSLSRNGWCDPSRSDRRRHLQRRAIERGDRRRASDRPRDPQRRFVLRVAL
ncbi:MAG TPA: hypothetical protein VGK67_20835 [Myxococcales bacterium]|jgi:hypothetical protein